MPTVRLAPHLEMHYLVDDYTDPWCEPETILLLHGNCESSATWYAWVPHLARHFRVVRPDMRGYGASTPVPSDFPWSLDALLRAFLSACARSPSSARRRPGTMSPHASSHFPPRSSSTASSTGRGAPWRAGSAATFRPKA